jgi:mannosyl-oligosaccharide alpha-1,2-mannosidase
MFDYRLKTQNRTRGQHAMAIRRRRLALAALAACTVFFLWRLFGSGQLEWIRQGQRALLGLQDQAVSEHSSWISSHTPDTEYKGVSSTAKAAAAAPPPLPEHQPGQGFGEVALEAPADEDRQQYIFAHPIPEFVALPKATGNKLPRIQYEFPPETPAARDVRQERLAKIKEAMLHSWRGYRTKAWMKDELAPVTGGHRTTFGGWAATLVDALDTLWLMGFKDEFEEAVQAVAGIDFDTPAHLPINVFETTIRYLGGLLGAYEVSDHQYPVLLAKAREVGEMLYPAFDTPNHMPVTRWSKMSGVEPAGGGTLIAELASLGLEFTRLSQLTGDLRWYDAVQRISDCLEGQQPQTKVPGLFPHTVNARECWFGDGVSFSLGGSSDSAYEYLPKQYQLLQGGSEQPRKMYEAAVEPLKRFVLFKPLTPTDRDILMAGTFKAYKPDHTELVSQVQHLACFAGGMFALGARLFGRPQDLNTARQLTEGCIWAYNSTPTGIMPELFNVVPCPAGTDCKWDEHLWAADMLRRNSHDESPADKKHFSEDERIRKKQQRLRLPTGISAIAARGYELRPEAVESVFVLYRITGDKGLRETAWTMFEAITSRTRTPLAFASLDDVTDPNTRIKIDRMESFWMGETLKYFWLLFEDPSVVSLDEFVLNTEAHPLRVK